MRHPGTTVDGSGAVGNARTATPIDEHSADPPIAKTARRLRSTPLASTPVAVAIHAIERGMQVVARLDAAAESERAALADEIAALLASHGYAPARIIVTGRAPHGRY